MRRLSAHDVLHVWERAQDQHPVDRALTLLATACPDITRDELASLTVGQRDARLLTLRERTFGAELDGLAKCPNCAEHLQITLAVPDIRVVAEHDEGEEPMELSTNGLRLRFRLPNSWDIAAAAGCEDTGTARRLLLQRCLIHASRDGAPAPLDELPEEATAGIATRMSEADRQAEVLLDLNCPACSHRWQIMFDIVSFFWAEISAHARRLLSEVHALARAYGWREADILSMSSSRRQSYLGMAT
jgi:hypothetical protein